jgi:hypothetical protein
VLRKPEALCSGCPLYGPGEMSMGYVPDELRDVPIAILAQAPGEHEEKGQKVVAWEQGFRGRRTPVTEPHPPAPLLGATGWDVWQTYAPLAGLSREQVSCMNVLKCRQIINGRRVNDLPQGRVLEQAVQHCTSRHLKIPSSTRLIIAMGALAAKYLGCPGSISSWRGYTWPIPKEVAA